MFASFLLVLREVMEAALVVTIVMAATRKVQRRELYIGAGILLGILGALLIAGFTSVISNAFGGAGQEIFNAFVLFTAVVLLAWHVVWMSSHGRELTAELKSVGHDVTIGTKPLSALAIIVAAAVLREGSEIVLFMQGLLSGSNDQNTLFIGAILGLAGGIIFGALLYFGMLRIPLGRLFSATNGLLIAIAAGMAAKAANYLIAANIIPEWQPRLWDSSAFLSDDSFAGSTLSALLGYTATPSGMQIIFFAFTLLGILSMAHFVKQHAATAKI